MSRAPRGACGLKLIENNFLDEQKRSRPTRGVWIETGSPVGNPSLYESRPTRGVWIETFNKSVIIPWFCVAPHAGRVD
ncbi:MAG: hypothetical protein PWP62_822 [Eubacteriaceae bacterium]|nr:hypothetical protein [Eubacteriaceae bacterium]